MPTHRQKRTATKMVETGGNVSKAMVAGGYSPKTAHNPKKLTDSNGWKELMESNIPDDLLARKHQELLNKKVMFVSGKGKARKTLATKEIDATAVAKGLDLAYKIKNKYPAERVIDEGVRGKVDELSARLKVWIEGDKKK